jgi:hypothetical protein
MTTDVIGTGGITLADAREQDDELMWVRLALARALEASLDGSRKALLEGDLAGIERGTSNQIGLLRGFAAVLQRAKGAPATRRKPAEAGALEGAHARRLEEELRHSENRSLDALRLQAALLVRARAKLRVLGNMLAGPSVPYGPFIAAKSPESGGI